MEIKIRGNGGEKTQNLRRKAKILRGKRMNKNNNYSLFGVCKVIV